MQVVSSGENAAMNVSPFAGNINNTLYNLTLSRITFETNVRPPHTFNIRLAQGPPNPLLVDRNVNVIPAGINTSLTNPLFIGPPNPTLDTDRDGYYDWYEDQKGFSKTDPASHPVLGDINGDGAATLLDAILFYRDLADDGIPQGLAASLDRADLIYDGQITTEDARILYRWAAGDPAYPGIPLLP
jgi:hypothetical protein